MGHRVENESGKEPQDDFLCIFVGKLWGGGLETTFIFDYIKMGVSGPGKGILSFIYLKILFNYS